MDGELRAIYEQDQADRRDKMPPDVRQRDQERRERVEALIAAGALQNPADYFHAAMVFQHGETIEHIWRAHELALKAAELGHRGPARWLAAAAYDRWLMCQDKPQKYGTQYLANGDGWKLWAVDPTTTDEERAAWDVPPLAEALARAEQMTRAEPPQFPGRTTLASLAVPGLRVEIVRLEDVGLPEP